MLIQLRSEEEKLIQELEKVELEQQHMDELIAQQKEEAVRLEESEAKWVASQVQPVYFNHPSQGSSANY